MTTQFYSQSVELVGFYGGDKTHALSAWTSTGRDLTVERKKRIGPMLRTLAAEGHHTPFEKSYLHFLVRCDMASHIHLLKHRIGVSINAESARYKQLQETSAYIPDDWPTDLADELRAWSQEGQRHYNEALARLEPTHGRARAKESARFFLPYANQLTIDIGFNFRSFMHFVGLRAKPDAQHEIREIATNMLDLVHNTGAFPLSLAAFGHEERAMTRRARVQRFLGRILKIG